MYQWFSKMNPTVTSLKFQMGVFFVGFAHTFSVVRLCSAVSYFLLQSKKPFSRRGENFCWFMNDNKLEKRPQKCEIFKELYRKMFNQVREEENKLTVLKMKILPVCQRPSSAKSALEINTCKCSWNLMGNICVMVTDSLEFLVALGARIHTQRGQRSPTGLGAYQSCQKTEKYPFKIVQKKVC